jgi:hypothetical protein
MIRRRRGSSPQPSVVLLRENIGCLLIFLLLGHTNLWNEREALIASALELAVNFLACKGKIEVNKI